MTQHPDPIDLVFRALADRGRRSMIERLTAGPASVSELAGMLDMSLSAVGQHLKLLEDAGLVMSLKQGRVRQCMLRHRPMRMAERWLSDRRDTWEDHVIEV